MHLYHFRMKVPRSLAVSMIMQGMARCGAGVNNGSLQTRRGDCRDETEVDHHPVSNNATLWFHVQPPPLAPICNGSYNEGRPR
jgi:hypothetical protein